MNKFEDLEKLGFEDIKMTQARFIYDWDFYVQIANQVLEDNGYQLLKEQLQNQQCKESFNTAHMLKGIISNCGFTPMLNTIVSIVEPLRQGTPNYEELSKLFDQLIEQRDAIKASFD